MAHEKLLSGYEKARNDACQWCKEGKGFSTYPRVHFTGSYPGVLCTAPTRDEYDVALEAKLAAAEKERDAAIADTARMDWLEALITNVAWTRKSWLYRGGSGPEIVPEREGEKWPEGITQGSCRAAIDAARASSDQDGGEESNG